MPKCAVGYCSRPREPRSKYCKKHQGYNHKEYNKRNDDRYRRFYQTKEWRQLRNEYITSHPYCEICYSHGVIRRANLVHHKIEIRDDWSKRLNWDNLQSVCTECHNKIHHKTQYKRV